MGTIAMRGVFCAAFCAATMVAAYPAAAATNYLTNGSFETGDFTGWDQSAIVGYTGVSDFFAQSGVYGAFFGAEGADSVISQTFSDVAGESLTISAWIASDGNVPSDVALSFNGTSVLALNPVPRMDYTLYTVIVTATGNDTFAIAARNDPGLVWVDNVSVSPTSGTEAVASAIPEASTWAMLLLGFLGLGGASLRARLSRPV